MNRMKLNPTKTWELVIRGKTPKINFLGQGAYY